MTDPETADRTYICPMIKDSIEDIIKQEKPQAILPTMGGQTALNLAIELSKSGILEKYDVELIGAKLEAIEKVQAGSVARFVAKVSNQSVKLKKCLITSLLLTLSFPPPLCFVGKEGKGTHAP